MQEGLLRHKSLIFSRKVDLDLTNLRIHRLRSGVANSPKVIILAGGLGTRISEETSDKPKPMVLIDDRPILWHLMNTFADQGYENFVLALGYRSDVIKRWLLDLNELNGDITIETGSRNISRQNQAPQNNWIVSALETGLYTQTGGRVKQAMQKNPGERVIATYGDGLANININSLLKFHISHGKLATVTAVRPPARFGYLEIDGDAVTHFGEKKQTDVGWINGGFFVLEPEVVSYIKNNDEPFETGALPRLAENNQLMAFQHPGFWQPMDTLREKHELQKLAEELKPIWLRRD